MKDTHQQNNTSFSISVSRSEQGRWSSIQLIININKKRLKGRFTRGEQKYHFI